MIDQRDIERLAAMRIEEGVLSASIKLDPQLGFQRDQAERKFKGGFRRAVRAAGDAERTILERERDRVLGYLKDARPQGRAVVIYSSEPGGLFEVVELDVMVPTQVTAGTTPDTTTLTRIIDEYPRMAVVILDGGDARIFTAQQGSGREQASQKSEIPGRHQQGGWSQARYQRHIEFHQLKHLKEVAEELQAVFKRQPFDRLVLVGVEEATKEFESLLSESVRRRVMGHMTASFKHENDSEILERARALREEDERSEEVALIDRIRGLAEAGGKGSLGVDDTLAALNEGRVDTLVVAEGVTREGSQCLGCDHLASQPLTKCPACGGNEIESAPDVIELAIERALLTGAKVNIAFGAGQEMLVSAGGIGAILRY
jgi:peptide chain release factor subunit 1